MNLEEKQLNLTYQKALHNIESIEAPAIGFALPSEYKTTFDLQKAIIKQNNTLLSLLIGLSTHVQDLQTQVKKLQSQADKPTAAISKENSIFDLTKRLGGLHLGAEQIVPKKTGKILIFKNPSDILQKEKQK